MWGVYVGLPMYATPPNPTHVHPARGAGVNPKPQFQFISNHQDSWRSQQTHRQTENQMFLWGRAGL